MFPILLMKDIWKDTDYSLVCSWPKLNQEGQQKEFKKKKTTTTAKPSNTTLLGTMGNNIFPYQCEADKLSGGMRPALFCDIMQHIVVRLYQHFRRFYWSHLQGSIEDRTHRMF